jgi:hypothetical protein
LGAGIWSHRNAGEYTVGTQTADRTLSVVTAESLNRPQDISVRRGRAMQPSATGSVSGRGPIKIVSSWDFKSIARNWYAGESYGLLGC